MRLTTKLISMLLALCMVAAMLPMTVFAGTAASGSCGDNLTWKLENGVLTISGEGAMENYSYYGDSAPWYDYSSSVNEVVIGDGVTSIGDYAFYNCFRLTSIVIPDSVTSIGDDAFDYCSRLTSIVIPDSVTSIGDYAFYRCSGLTSIVIPDGVTSIGDDAFSDCSGLTSAGPIGGGYDYEFSWTESIPSNAFDGCSGLTSVVIPDSVTSIGDYAFNYCSSLTSIVLPTGVTSIGDWAFSGCSDLTSIVIPDSVTSIGHGTFYYCSSLTSIVIPDNVTSIGDWAFSGCSCLTSIVLPDSVTIIGSGAFSHCSGLTSIVIPDSITSIGYGAFEYCTGLTSIVIPDSVTNIGAETFFYCSSLTSVVIPDSVTIIGDYAFDGCSGLTSIVLPDSVTSIGPNAFLDCSGLTSVVIPGNVTIIGEHAFDGCSRLNAVTINSAAIVKSITSSTSCGYLCSYAATVAIPSSIDTIGSYITDNYTYTEKVDINGIEYTLYSNHDHTWEDAVVSKYVQCKTDGVTNHKCTVCGFSYDETVPAHDFAPEWTVDIEPTKDSAGLKSRHCTRCDETTDPIEIAKLVEIVDSSKLFTDLEVKSWSIDGINYVVSYGYMNGTSADKFSQTGTMTRAMIVSVLWRMADKPTPESANPFADLEANQTWYHDAVVWAYENGIVTGTSNTTFSPTGAVTREQMATFLYRYAKYLGYNVSEKADLSSFPDASKVGSWAYDALAWANAEGLITGAKNGNVTLLDPQGEATREQVATILMRFCENYK